MELPVQVNVHTQFHNEWSQIAQADAARVNACLAGTRGSGAPLPPHIATTCHNQGMFNPFEGVMFVPESWHTWSPIDTKILTVSRITMFHLFCTSLEQAGRVVG